MCAFRVWPWAEVEERVSDAEARDIKLDKARLAHERLQTALRHHPVVGDRQVQ
jgi:hypothetical protein